MVAVDVNVSALWLVDSVLESLVTAVKLATLIDHSYLIQVSK